MGGVHHTARAGWWIALKPQKKREKLRWSQNGLGVWGFGGLGVWGVWRWPPQCRSCRTNVLVAGQVVVHGCKLVHPDLGHPVEIVRDRPEANQSPSQEHDDANRASHRIASPYSTTLTPDQPRLRLCAMVPKGKEAGNGNQSPSQEPDNTQEPDDTGLPGCKPL